MLSTWFTAGSWKTGSTGDTNTAVFAGESASARKTDGSYSIQAGGTAWSLGAGGTRRARRTGCWGSRIAAQRLGLDSDQSESDGGHKQEQPHFRE